MDSIEFKHLILDLKTTLNGDEEFFGSVRYLRYLSILAFASIAENFKEEGMNKNGILYFNLYTLQKIADFSANVSGWDHPEDITALDAKLE